MSGLRNSGTPHAAGALEGPPRRLTPSPRAHRPDRTVVRFEPRPDVWPPRASRQFGTIAWTTCSSTWPLTWRAAPTSFDRKTRRTLTMTSRRSPRSNRDGGRDARNYRTSCRLQSTTRRFFAEAEEEEEESAASNKNRSSIAIGVVLLLRPTRRIAMSRLDCCADSHGPEPRG